MVDAKIRLINYLAAGFLFLVLLSFTFLPVAIEAQNKVGLFLPLWILQTVILFFTVIGASKLKGFAWFISAAAFHILLVNVNLFYFWSFNAWFFEYVGSDSTLYAQLGSELKEIPTSYWVNHMHGTKYDYQDFGFPFIKGILYSIGFNEYGMRQLNSVVVFLTAFFVFKSIIFASVNKNIARMFAAVYLVNPVTVYFASSGLKETFFAFFITLHFYAFTRLSRIRWATTSIFSLATIPLFRMPVVIMILLSHLITFTRFVRIVFLRRLVLYGVIVTFAALVFLNLDQISDVIHFVKRIGAGKLSAGSTSATVALLVSGVIGPLPSYDLTGPDYSQSQYFIGLFLKMLLMIFFFNGIRTAFLEWGEILAISLFCILCILPLILIGETLKIRYHMVYWPQFFILCSIGFLRWPMNRNYRLVLFSWALICAIVTITWNLVI